MKEFNPNMPQDVLARHKLVAYVTLMAIRDLLGSNKVENTEVVAHTSKEHTESLLKELKQVGLKVVAVCNGGTCTWNVKGLGANGDRQVKIDPRDTYFLDSDVVVLDESNDYIDLEDSKSFKSKILIETGKNITEKAKVALKERGIEVIPHQFFQLYPLKNVEDKNVKDFAEGIHDVWTEVSKYAKSKHVSFDNAFEYIKSQQML
tara:strand:- start:216389 stop:217003 length:615 start_codon:yes stop_codon:yes gene_type:complete